MAFNQVGVSSGTFSPSFGQQALAAEGASISSFGGLNVDVLELARTELMNELKSKVVSISSSASDAALLEPLGPGSNIVGMGVGYRDLQPGAPGAIVVAVRSKKPISQCAPWELIPPDYHGIPTQVVETGNFTISPGNAAVSRPVNCGRAIGSQGVNDYGTLGAMVVGQVAGQEMLCILSNSHVIAQSGAAAIGRPVVQPGASSQIIANFARAIPLSDNVLNLGDAALATTEYRMGDPNRRFVRPELPTFSLYGGTPTSGAIFKDAFVGQGIKKYGARTDETFGQITGIKFQFAVSGYPGGKTYTFREVILTSANFGNKGDSGSLVVSSIDHYPVGLYFGDNATNTTPASFSLLSPIKEVIDALGITRFFSTTAELESMLPSTP
jgi:hypothetical protein